MEGRSWRLASEADLIACYDATVTDVFRYAARLTGDRAAAEDLVSEAYLSLLRATRDDMVGDVTVGWLITVVRRRHVDRLRYEQREARRLRLVEPIRDATPDETPDLLDETMRPLSARERTAITLRYVDDLSVAVVAHEMGLSVRATESLLARARNRMRRSEVRDA